MHLLAVFCMSVPNGQDEGFCPGEFCPAVLGRRFCPGGLCPGGLCPGFDLVAVQTFGRQDV